MSKPHPFLRNCISFLWIIYCGAAFASTALDAIALQQDYRTMEEGLLHSPLQRPLILRSQESAEHLSGDLYASVEYGMAALSVATGNTQRWCEIMLLLSNTKACRSSNSNSTSQKNSLSVAVSSSKSADAAGATTTEFQLDNHTVDGEYLDSGISAKDGPMGTQDIIMRLQAVPISPTRSFVHLHYSYNTHWLGRVAMQAYLQTLGRGKVGFTLTSTADASTPTYIGGPRSVIERNTMRYFLGLDCALASADQEPPQRFNAMVGCWYSQIEKYPLQLHEMPRAEYLQMKASQYQR
jgi:hypothetical protein